MALFKEHINTSFSLSLKTYPELHAWACNHLELFWETFWNYAGIISSEAYTEVLSQRSMPGAEWFKGAKLNYAEHCLRFNDDHTAIIGADEKGEYCRTSYKQLAEKVSLCEQFLRQAGVKKGDRVAALATHCEETIVTFLATASIGAIWSSCSPDFGNDAILARFSQIEPTCFVFVDSYQFKGKSFDLSERITSLLAGLPTVSTCLHLDRVSTSTSYPHTTRYSTLSTAYAPQPIHFEQLSFSHPLYILFSSGTTGKPKSITHSAGGSLIEHIKEQRLHGDLKREDVFFYYTSCSWMMWNWQVSGLASGTTLLVFDGSPFYPKKLSTWELIDEYGITIYGTSAKFINASLKFKLSPKEHCNLSTLRAILSTGSPLFDEDFDYVYEHVKPSVQLSSISGGTDIVGCFALGNPMMPVRRGELQSISLGYPVQAYSEEGTPLFDEKGELVCEAPCPSMPISFWNDPSYEAYKKSYFSVYPGKWHHSDFIKCMSTGGVHVLGRSDATLNRAGIRIGTAEIYAVVEALQEIKDSVVIHLEAKDSMILFIDLEEGHSFSPELNRGIQTALKEACSPRHCPNRIYPVPGIPYTKNGKKVELAVKHIFLGQDDQINTASLGDESVLAAYKDLYLKHFALVKS